MKYAVIINNEVINIILWDGLKPVTFPNDATVIKSDTLAIGMKFDGTKWYMPVTPYVEPDIQPDEFMSILTGGKDNEIQ